MLTEKWLTKQISPEIFYKDIEAHVGLIPDKANYRPVPNGLFWSLLGNKIIYLCKEYSATPEQKECSDLDPTSYGPISTETIMLMLGLMASSWFKVNVKKKTEKGHCNNKAHEPVTETKPTNCPIGSRFHSNLYNDYIAILEDFLNKARDCTPTPIRSISETKEPGLS